MKWGQTSGGGRNSPASSFGILFFFFSKDHISGRALPRAGRVAARGEGDI